MEFDRIVKEKLELIFRKNKLLIVEQFKNYIKLKSENVVLVISHDERENSNGLFVGKDDSFLFPIDEYVLQNAFDFNEKLNYVTPEVFVKNLVLFFNEKGKELILGNEYALKAVQKYVSAEGKRYTENLIEKQNIMSADKAWDKKNYLDFVMYLDKMKREKLPASYDLKYKIALQKLKEI